MLPPSISPTGTPSMRIILSFLAALLLVGCSLTDETPTYRYRLTVEVDTPQGVRSGSSVIEVDTRAVRPGSNPARQGVEIDVRGEAVAVDLPDGQTLFALLRSDNDVDWAGRVMLLLSPRTNEPFLEQFDNMLALRGRGALELPRMWPPTGFLEERSAYPMLVTFGDLDDPTSVTLVNPDDLAASFGEGVTLRRITVEMTDEPMTEGIVERLEWLRDLFPGMLNGDRFEDFRKSDFAARISVGAFSTELNR